MDRRFQDELNFRFDQVADVGFAVITDDEVLRWWDRRRVTASIWQDLLERWEERGFEAPLLISYFKHKYTLGWGDPNWMVPVSDWAGGTSEPATKE